jgi:alpha,alpha-trehalase
MLGLMADGRRDLGQGLVTNFAYQIDHYGHVPNGNRSYYLSRSQPPFFHLMVGLMAPTGANGAAPKPDDLAREYARYLAQLRREHAYWMDGAGRLAPGQAARHAVAMPDGAILNRYWDERDTPRDESYREDVETAARSSRPAAQVYRDLRAGAESGWDYSSRWLANGHDLHTIHTTDLIPIDLNSLLYGLEQAVSDGCRWAKDLPCMREFHTLAVRRRMAIERYLWDGQRGIYADLDWKKAQRQTQLTAATLMPLFMDIASPAKAASVARAVRAGLLGKYGLLTTPDESGQQWDAPNGWAPLQWMAIDGLRRHGQPQLASDIAKRWMNTVDLVYRETGKLTEKYNVVQQGKGGGGEYPGQDGFGWTNGVMARLLMMYPEAQTRTQAQTQAHQLPTKSSRTCGAPC